MLDILRLHKPEDNRDARCWILATGKDLRSKINFLYSSLLEKMTREELIRRLNKYTGINLEINLDGLIPKKWLKNNIRKLRIKKGFTKKKIAKLTGTSGRDWTRFEEGKRLPNCKKLRKIANILDIKIESICQNDDFCLRSLDVVVDSLEKLEWIPLVVISGLLEIYKKEFNIQEDNFNEIKNKLINSTDFLRVLQDNSKSIKAVKEIDGILAKIIGAFAADGNFYPPDMIRWEDEYEEQLEVLSNWFKISFGFGLRIKPSKRERNSFTTRFRNKIIGRYLEIFFGFHPIDKRYTVNEPELIKQQSLEIRKYFASGALMFDGSVNCDGTVGFSSVSKKFRDSISEILLKDGIKISVTKKPSSNKWSFVSSRELNLHQLRKLSFYFEKNILKRKILDFYSGDLKISSTDDFRVLFPKIRNKIRPADLFSIITMMDKFDVYQIIKITNLSRKLLLTYLRILEKANLVTSNIYKRKRIYSLNNWLTNHSLSNSLKSE